MIEFSFDKSVEFLNPRGRPDFPAKGKV